MNRVTLIGKVGATPRGGATNGTVYSNFSLSTHESYVNKQGAYINKTLLHRIVAFGNAADFCNLNINTGTTVQVEGRINYRDYIDNNGLHTTAIEIVAFMVRIIGGQPAPRQTVQPSDYVTVAAEKYHQAEVYPS